MDTARHQYQHAEVALAAADASYNALLKAYDASEKAAAKPKRKRSPRKDGGASDDTKKLFQALHSGFGVKGFGYKDIEFYANVSNLKINMNTMRSNVRDYVQKGYLSSQERGRFEITEDGKVFFGIFITPVTPKSMPGGSIMQRSTSIEAPVKNFDLDDINF